MATVKWRICLMARILFLVALLRPSGNALHAPSAEIEMSLIHEFPKPTWLENLAVMENGSILATEMTSARLWLIDPLKPNSPAILIHEFPGYLGCLGIVETLHNSFAIVTGNFSFEGPKSTPGSYTVWSVNMGLSRLKAQVATIQKIADTEQADFINGISYLGQDQNALLLADSTLGLVFRLDHETAKVQVAIDDPLMKKCSPTVLEGINGMKVFNGYLYFTNAYCGYLAKVPISRNGSARGASSISSYTDAPGKYIFDDFVIDRHGTIYVASGNKNSVTKVSASGHALDIAGSLNSTEIAEPTALAFGRTLADQHILYVTTGGGMGDPINDTVVVGGQLLALDLRLKHI